MTDLPTLDNFEWEDWMTSFDPGDLFSIEGSGLTEGEALRIANDEDALDDDDDLFDETEFDDE